ncbi:hypothetical protein MHTCC0001_02700 [Flavobacteriaceae bacterium MHTCC 0001]
MKRNFNSLLLTVLFSFILISGCGEKKAKTALVSYTVDAVTNKDYEFTGGDITKAENPTLTLKRGETYEFVVKASGHPFYIKTEKIPGKDKAYNSGVTNNGASDDVVLVFAVPKDAPDVLYYVCQYHKLMSGELKIVD